MASLALPSTANAGEKVYWLLGAGGRNQAGISTFQIPIGTLAECEEAGKKFISHQSWQRIEKYRSISTWDYTCIKGLQPVVK